jgi:hypothetical protein
MCGDLVVVVSVAFGGVHKNIRFGKNCRAGLGNSARAGFEFTLWAPLRYGFLVSTRERRFRKSFDQSYCFESAEFPYAEGRFSLHGTNASANGRLSPPLNLTIPSLYCIVISQSCRNRQWRAIIGSQSDDSLLNYPTAREDDHVHSKIDNYSAMTPVAVGPTSEPLSSTSLLRTSAVPTLRLNALYRATCSGIFPLLYDNYNCKASVKIFMVD